jgi:prophage DNA circulation protein
VPFLLRSSSRAGGRKTATHEYPNTDRRYVEDLGKTVPTFSIQATIHGDSVTYIAERDRFIAALETKGAGQLTHPFYGNLNVACIEYNLTEDMGAIGRCEISITFAITGPVNAPAIEEASASLIASKTDELVGDIRDYVAAKYNTSTSSSSLSKVGHSFNVGMLRNFNTRYGLALSAIRAVSLIGSTESAAAEAQKIKMANKENTIVSDTEQLNDSLVDSMDLIRDTDADADVLYTAYSKFFYFQQEQVLPVATTIQRVRNEENFRVITGAVSIMCLCYAYEQAALIEYKTSDDLEITKQALENQYQYILSIKNVDYELINALQEIRSDMREFFEQAEESIYKVIAVSSSSVIPLSVLAFQYYGNLDLTQDLVDLNLLSEPSFVDSTVRILVKGTL